MAGRQGEARPGSKFVAFGAVQFLAHAIPGCAFQHGHNFGKGVRMGRNLLVGREFQIRHKDTGLCGIADDKGTLGIAWENGLVLPFNLV